MKRNGIENLSLTGKLKGKRARDGQRLTDLNNVKEWTNTANRNDFIQACEERERWRCVGEHDRQLTYT